MKETPILFSGPMVRAILEGRKIQTRRLAFKSVSKPDGFEADSETTFYCRPTPWFRRYEKWQAGHHELTLWVRETWANVNAIGSLARPNDAPQTVLYKATCHGVGQYRWRPSIQMPRWASRIDLRVTDMRLERLQDISEDDARAEGCGLYVAGHGWITETELHADPGYSNFISPRLGWEDLWKSIHGPGAWDSNPEVVVITFERIKP